MRMDRRRYDLSGEARGLLRGGGFDHVELADGPAAQRMIFGVAARYVPEALMVEPEPDVAHDPDQPDWFDVFDKQ